MNIRNPLRTAWAAFRALLVLTMVTGVLYPLAVTGVAQAAFGDRADGSPVHSDGRDVGSSLIGQTWNDANGDPDPRWFQPRPSHSGYDPTATGSSQLGASDPTLLATVEETRAAVAAFNGVPESAVPPDAVTGSASALDPHISPTYAEIQVARVASANGLSPDRVEQLVANHTEGRDLGFLGDERVNVLELNVALRAVVTAGGD